MNIFDISVSIIIELARILIIFFYFRIFLNGTNKIKHICMCALSFIITTGFYIILNNSILNIISTIAGALIISLAFEGKIKSKFLLSILCCSLMIILDVVAYCIFGNKGNEDVYNLVASFLSILFFYMAIMLLKLLFRKRMKTEFIGQWYILLVVSVMSICLLVGVYKEMAFSAYGMVYISVILLVVNFLLYVFYTNMLDRYVYYKENEQLKQQMNFYEHQLKANVENDRKIRAIRHDMKHHIREINALAESGKIEEIRTYTKELANDIKQSETIYNTGNVMFDGVLNYYMGMFIQKSIKSEVNVVIPENLNISTYDLNIILGNLFDNAIENVVNSSNPMVIVDVKYDGHALYVSIANTYDGKVRKNDGVIISRKVDGHGFGLDNIRRIAKKYEGCVKIEHSNRMFIVGVVLYV